MTHPIDQLMEQASQALARMDYPTCEQHCLEAAAGALADRDYERIARIMLPLQEARRQRRHIAADAGVFVLGGDRLTPRQLLDRHETGCLMLISPPYTVEDEQALRDLARAEERYIEVLLMDDQARRAAFLGAMEARGDAMLARISHHQPAGEQVAALVAEIDRIGDHEIAHQRLAEIARRAAREQAAGAAGMPDSQSSD